MSRTPPTGAPPLPLRGRPATDPTNNLNRVRWAVRATLMLGVAASVAANILHANPNPISQAIAAWPPIALLLTVELISRIPVHRPVLATVRLAAATAIAAIAAWVSYWHLAGVAARYGEVGASAYLLPLSVDGLIVAASVSLVELSSRLRPAQSHHRPASPPQAPFTAPATPRPDALRHRAAHDDQPPADTPDEARADQPHPAPAQAAAPPEQTGDPHPSSNGGGAATDANTADAADGSRPGEKRPGEGSPPRRRRGATRQAVINTYLQNPTMHPTAIAEAVGTSERSVRRYLDELRTNAHSVPTNSENKAGNTPGGNPA